MKLFTTSIFFITVFLLSLLLLIPAFNLHLFIKHGLNRGLFFIHTASVFAEAFFFSLIMQFAIMPDYNQSFYRIFSIISFICVILLIILILIQNIFNKTYTTMDTKLSPNLNDVFQTMEDAVFVVDSDGIILSINQSGLAFISQHSPTQILLDQEILSPKINTLNELSSFIISNLPYDEQGHFLQALETSFAQIELTINQSAYLFLITPIHVNSLHSSYIGFNLVFHNIQEEKVLRTSLELQNYELALANEALRDRIKIANTLEEQNERLLLIRELQDSIIKNIEKVTDTILHFKNQAHLKTLKEHQSFIGSVAENLRHIFNEVRSSIQKFSAKF